MECENGEKTIVIHRPYFMPWLGYFAKLVYADVFVVMDDVFFTKRHYIDRVQIINPQGELMWLSLKTVENYNTRCDQIKLPQSFLVDEIAKTLAHSYSKARYYRMYYSEIVEILERARDFSDGLVEFDIKIVELILKLLSLPSPQIYYGSNFEYVDNPTERLILLCKETECSKIIMGSGGSVDIHNISKLKEEGVSILYQDFYNHHPSYYQTRRQRIGFAKGLSIVDCIFNEGIDFTRKVLLDEKFRPYELI